MKALKVVKYGRFPSLIIEQKPIRSHRQDILVRMKFAPINPSDINFFQGRYGIRKTGTPIVGFEGSGVIQQAENQALQGRTVSVLANSMNGTYSSHIITNLKDIIIWPEQINSSIQQLSMAWINPFSCLGLVSKTEKYFPSEVFISAATSSLSRIIIPQLRRKSNKKLTIYGFSRNPQYDKQLLQLGYDVILRTNLQTLQLQFKTKVISKQSAVFLDCIGGQFASQIFKLLPHSSIMINYGRLSKQQLKIDVADLYFKNKNIQGFWLNQFISQISQIEFFKFKSILQINFKPFTQKIRKVFPIAQHLQAYKLSISESSEGKILLDLQ